MGLDAYLLTRDRMPGDTDTSTVEKAFEELDATHQLGYYRKFNALHAWMEDRWREQTYEEYHARADIKLTQEEWQDYKKNSFNCMPYFMNAEDIDRLIAALDAKTLKGRDGFFFGSSDDAHVMERIETEKPDLIKALLEAKENLKRGGVVYYDSWW